MKQNQIELLLSFDSTGSMYPCLAQVRAQIKQTCQRLFRDIPNLRIGLIAHGDYCDAGSTYVTSILDLTSDPETVSAFVQGVRPTHGGDAPECYELVLREARTKIRWTPGSRRCFVLIGDDVPHGPLQNPDHIDWRTELAALAKESIPVYGVQCLGRSHARPFYEELAQKSGGFHVTLDQFSYVTDLVMAVCYQQQGESQIQQYEEEVNRAGRMSRGLDRVFASLRKRGASSSFETTDLRAVHPSRFQVLSVGRDCAIKDFVTENGLLFKVGRGFYEFTKTETIQGHKEIVLMDRKTGDLYSGTAARDLLGLFSTTARIRPASLDKYAVFVQSTSVNRRLVGGTRFLYEVDVSR